MLPFDANPYAVRHRLFSFLVVCALILHVGVQSSAHHPVHAAADVTPDVVVNTLVDDPNGCPTACTLRSAINSAPAGGVIGFAESLKGSIKVVDAIEITKDVTIAGRGADISVIDGQKKSQIFIVKNAKVKIVGLKLQNAIAKRVGGAIEVQEGSLELSDSLFVNNTANEGGALSVNGRATLVINHVEFSNNSAGGGGALYTEGASTVTINDSLFQGNTAVVDGGAISNRGKTQITQTAFIGNKVRKPSGSRNAPNGGGAIYNLLTGRLAITTCTFTKNQSDNDGGAILNFIGTTAPDLTWVVIDSSTFNENVAEHSGGAIANYLTSPLTLINSTITGNLAKDNGGGFYNKGGVVQIQFSTLALNGAKKTAGGIFIDNGTMTLSSSIVAKNVGKPVADISGKVKSGGSNLIGNPTGVSGLFASDQQKVDPQLLPLGMNDPGTTATMGLKPSSPAVGKGGTSCPQTDQRGVQRKNPCDAGAYESGT